MIGREREVGRDRERGRGRGREREIGTERDIYAYFGFLVTLHEPHPVMIQDRPAVKK